MKAGSYGFSLTLVVGPAETTFQPSPAFTHTGPQWYSAPSRKSTGIFPPSAKNLSPGVDHSGNLHGVARLQRAHLPFVKRIS